MDEKEQIEQLQRELVQLQKLLKEQQESILSLHKRLMQISKDKNMPLPSVQPKIAPQAAWSSENFIGLRLIHLVGIVVLVIGLSIGVKYAIDRNLISEGARIGLAYGAGIALWVLSVRFKARYEAFSAILLSGAMASIYFTTYGSAVYYSMMPSGAAFALMVGLTFFTVYQAIVYNRKEIALLGLVGAYAIPFLISANADRADLFFLYISLINIGVVYLSYKKGWTVVSGVAQAATWLLFIGWATMQEGRQNQGIGFVFMSFIFLLFLFNSVTSRLLDRHPLAPRDAYAIMANSLALYLSALFVFASSFSDADIARVTLVMTVLTALQAFVIDYWWQERLAKTILAVLSLLFLTIFIATQWDGLIVTLLWLLTAVLVFAFGVLRRSGFGRMVAISLMGLTLLKLVVFDSLTFTTVQKVISYIVLGVLLLVVSYFYQKYRQRLFSDKEL